MNQILIGSVKFIISIMYIPRPIFSTLLFKKGNKNLIRRKLSSPITGGVPELKTAPRFYPRLSASRGVRDREFDLGTRDGQSESFVLLLFSFSTSPISKPHPFLDLSLRCAPLRLLHRPLFLLPETNR